jgi:uncharacterized membrane protein
MPFDPAPFHPIVVHFAVALLIAGVSFRLVSLTGRLAFTGPAALVLLLAGTAAAVAAVESGEAASGLAEEIPGARDAVEEHETWGERTRNLFLAIAAVELAAVVLRRWGRDRPALIASGVLGVLGFYCVYEAGEHGGHVVFSYAGGVGVRGGDPADVGRLLLAGIYRQAMAAREAGRLDEAARLTEEAARLWPGNANVQLMVGRSKLVDRHDAAAALEVLGRLAVSREERALRLEHGLLLADALLAAGQKDAARASLQSLQSEFPDNPLVRDRLKAAGGS